MKAIVDINLANLRAFEKGKHNPKLGLKHLVVLKGEDLTTVLKQFKYSDEEIRATEIRILRGNPHWLEVKSEDDKKKVKEVKKDKEAEQKRYDELEKLNKKEQVEMLKKLGAKKIPGYEDDRIKLIMKLEK